MDTHGRHHDADGRCAVHSKRKNKKENVKEGKKKGGSYARLHGQTSCREDAQR